MNNMNRLNKFLLSILLLSSLFILSFNNNSFANNEIRIIMDGEEKQFDQSPVILEGRTLVPFRGIFEEYEARVEWDNDTQTVTAAKNNIVIQLEIGNKTARVNTTDILLDVDPQIINGRTMVPLRFISESLGASVEWDSLTRTILITSKQEIASTIDYRVSSNTIVLKNEVIEYTDSVYEDIVFYDFEDNIIKINTKSELRNLQVGNIFTLPPTEGYPLGIVKKVVLFSEEGTVQTVDPTIEELIDSIDLFYHQNIDLSQVDVIHLEENITYEYAETSRTYMDDYLTAKNFVRVSAQDGNNKSSGLSFNFNGFSVGIGSTEIKLDGSFTIEELELILDTNINLINPPEVKAEAIIKSEYNLKVGVSKNVKSEAQRTSLAQIPVGKVFIPISGPTGVLLELIMVVAIDGEGNANIIVKVNGIVGGEYNEEDLNIYGEHDINKKLEQVSGNVQGSIGIGTNISYALFQLSLIGFEVSNKLGVELSTIANKPTQPDISSYCVNMDLIFCITGTEKSRYW